MRIYKYPAFLRNEHERPDYHYPVYRTAIIIVTQGTTKFLRLQARSGYRAYRTKWNLTAIESRHMIVAELMFSNINFKPVPTGSE